MPVDDDFWLQRWQDANTPWHKDRTNTLLETYVDALALGAGAQVFVPLCGKAPDMTWLSEQGYRVLGVELSSIACEAFFAESAMHAARRDEGAFQVFEANSIRLLCGDIFALQREHVANTAAVYDRAALIALPPELRPAYVEHLSAILPAHVEWLIITLEYPPHDMTGPPFAVYEDELHQLFAGRKRIRRLKSRDILEEEPGLRARGATALSEHIFKLD